MIPSARHARPQAAGRAQHAAQNEHQETDIGVTG